MAARFRVSRLAALVAFSAVAVPVPAAVAAAEAPPAAAPAAVSFAAAVSQALVNNASVIAARHAWASAKRDAEKARGFSLPSLSFEERFVRTNVPAEAFALKMNEERLLASDFADVDNFNKPAPINDFVTSFTLEQPLFAPKAWLGYRMAGREAEAAGLDAARTREETVHRVLSAYVGARTAKEFVRVAGQGVSDAREHLRIAEALERAGMGLVSDTLRARVFVARAESGLVAARNRLAVAQTALGLAMGEAAGTRVDAAEPVPPLPDPGSLEGRIAALAANRSDLKAFSARIANAETNVTYERADYLPTVGATGAWQIDAGDGPFSPDNRTWKVGVGLKWNLFDGLRREAAVGKAAEERGRAKANYRGASDEAAFEVTRAYLSVEAASRRLEIAGAALAAAEEGARLVKARYENQRARMIDVLDAQSALDAARADHASAENDVVASRAELEYASGTLLSWAVPGETAAAAGRADR
ncbi:MAG: TolC family protein [Gemmatimonadota bacterium]